VLSGDRLDILGLASDGHLVVAKLKRDTAPDTVELQTNKYAAMASRFDIDRLADAYADFVSRYGNRRLSSEEATEALLAHTEYALSDETLKAPRITLIAGAFPSDVEGLPTDTSLVVAREEVEELGCGACRIWEGRGVVRRGRLTGGLAISGRSGRRAADHGSRGLPGR